MADPKIRGYSLQQQVRYLDSERFAPEVRARMSSRLPSELRDGVASFDPAAWYPRAHSVAVLRAIASVAKDEDEAAELLRSCGEFIGSEATNTFLKLLMKLMTPALFGKKLPVLWERDMQGGRLEADVSEASERRMKVRLIDVEGFDHIGPVTEGWIRFGLRSLGHPNVEIRQEGWSSKTPGPHTIALAVTW